MAIKGLRDPRKALRNIRKALEGLVEDLHGLIKALKSPTEAPKGLSSPKGINNTLKGLRPFKDKCLGV